MDTILRAQTRFFANTLYDFQKMRIQCTNRIDTLRKIGSPEEVVQDYEETIAKPLFRLEKEAHDKLAVIVRKLPIYDWLTSISGIGDRLAIAVVAYFPDPDDTPNVAKLWSYSGMGVIPVCATCKKIAHRGPKREQFIASQIERRWLQNQKKKREKSKDKNAFTVEWLEETQKHLCNCEEPHIVDCAPDKKYFKELLLNYNPVSKSLAWKCSWCFVMQGNFYRDIFDKYHVRYSARPDIKNKKRIALMAMRATSKLFLAHFWMKQRELSGLPQGKIYLQERYEREGIPFEPHMLILPPMGDKENMKLRKNGNLHPELEEEIKGLEDMPGMEDIEDE